MKHKNLYIRFPQGRAKTLTFSFDDGVVQDIRFVALLNRYGMKGTFNLNSGCFRQEGNQNSRVMTEAEARELFADGRHEVAVHTLTHPRLNVLPPAELIDEIYTDRKNLERIFGRLVRGMAYPFGTSGATEQSVSVARNSGIVYSRTTATSHCFDLPKDWLRLPSTCKYDDPRLMEHAKSFLGARTNDEALMFYVWGHTYEFDDYQHWDLIENFLKTLAGKEDEIWYATNMEIYEYVQAYERLEFSVGMELVYNPNAVPVWFYYNGTTYSVSPGQTLKLQ